MQFNSIKFNSINYWIGSKLKWRIGCFVTTYNNTINIGTNTGTSSINIGSSGDTLNINNNTMNITTTGTLTVDVGNFNI